MKLLFIGDGERDSVTIPHLVESLLSIKLDNPVTQTWRDARLHAKGFQSKLRFAVRQAIDARMDGVVATVDRDKAGNRERLKELRAGRQDDRNAAVHLPTAIGEADPHGEAWLLDDDFAVRKAFGLEKEVIVPAASSVPNPKRALEDLYERCPLSAEQFLGVISEIAQTISLKRCRNAKATGFAAFVEEVESEFRAFKKAS